MKKSTSKSSEAISLLKEELHSIEVSLSTRKSTPKICAVHFADGRLVTDSTLKTEFSTFPKRSRPPSLETSPTNPKSSPTPPLVTASLKKKAKHSPTHSTTPSARKAFSNYSNRSRRARRCSSTVQDAFSKFQISSPYRMVSLEDSLNQQQVQKLTSKHLQDDLHCDEDINELLTDDDESDQDDFKQDFQPHPLFSPPPPKRQSSQNPILKDVVKIVHAAATSLLDSKYSDDHLYAKNSNTTNSPDDSPLLGNDLPALDKSLAEHDAWGLGTSGFVFNVPSKSFGTYDSHTNTISSSKSQFMPCHALSCDETFGSPSRPSTKPSLTSLQFEHISSSPLKTACNTPKTPSVRSTCPRTQDITYTYENVSDCVNNENDENSYVQMEELDLSQFFSIRTIINEPDPEEEVKELKISIMELNLKRIIRPKAHSRCLQTPIDDVGFMMISSEAYLIDGPDDLYLKGLQHPDLGIKTNEILHYWYEREKDDKYVITETDSVQEHVRSLVVNWIFEVAAELKLHKLTAQTAINYLDRFYYHSETLNMDLHQPVAIVALYLASKRDELEPLPPVRFMEFTMMPTFTPAQFLAIERKILEFLDYRLMPVTYFDWTCLFLRRAAILNPKEIAPVLNSKCPANDLSIRIDYFHDISILLDIWMHCSDSLRYVPSLATACIFRFVLFEKLCCSLSTDAIDKLVSKASGFSSRELKTSDCYASLESRVFLRKDFCPLPNAEDFMGQDSSYVQIAYHDLPSYLSAPITDLETIRAEEDVGFGCLKF